MRREAANSAAQSPVAVRGCFICVALSITLLTGCFLPRSFKEVSHARGGVPLNDRVCAVYSQRYQIDLGGLEKLHTFDVNKYARIYVALTTDGLLRPRDVFVPEPITRRDLLRVHTPEYLADLRQPALLARYLELDLAVLAPAKVSDAVLLLPFRCATGGTLLAARLALAHGMAVNLGGGYHHAEPGRGGGFCIYADMPIAMRVLLDEGLIQRALVVDLDVHQGNGTARCIAADDRVFTFDMHQGNIYPTPKAVNDLDVPLRAGVGDDDYLALLAGYLPEVFDRATPDIVFLQAGADVLAGDPLAQLELTVDGIVKRDAMVFVEAHRRNIPIVMVLGGGYSPNAWYAQYQSIRNIIETYGLRNGRAQHGPRSPTVKEKVYVK